MGMYDREYYRDERGAGLHLQGMSMVGQLMTINIAIYIGNLLFGGDINRIQDFLSLRPGDLVQPWYWWRFVTYGFVHDPSNLAHIAMNMFVFWMFGRDIEVIYGRYEFMRLYLVSVVLGGLVWATHNYFSGPEAQRGLLLGASGAVTTMFLLFVLHYPTRTILIWFIPVPAWVAGVLFVLSDLVGAQSSAVGRARVAYDVHLVGAAFAVLYWRTGMRLYWLSPKQYFGAKSLLKRRPKLKVHQPQPDVPYEVLDERADAVLAKVNQHGIDSLTASERKILEAYSRRMQQKHR